MFKHIIIVLALCFMAYIVGNIDATTDRQRFNQFNDLVKCYKQLFEHELVKRNVARQSAKSSDTFKDIIKGFYAWCNIQTTDEKGTGELQPLYYDDRFTSDENLKHIKELFTQEFVQLSEEELKTKLNALKSNTSGYSEPLNTFIVQYKPESDTDTFKTVSTFCNEYRKTPQS